jgi:hypothetical protein
LIGAAVLRDPNRLDQARHRRVFCRRHCRFSFRRAVTFPGFSELPIRLP